MDKYPKHGGEEANERNAKDCEIEEIQRLGKLSLNHMREIKSVVDNPFYKPIPPDIAA